MWQEGKRWRPEPGIFLVFVKSSRVYYVFLDVVHSPWRYLYK